ncbi:MAG: dihydroorotate dehydrogenase (quinone), partial [Reinekea forsetii]|nr:dihydroorotate dehydrogenase (quinone) [Reinekea forsetii]
DTPEDQAVDDYLYCLDRVYEVADYIVINLSSPNTPGLRNLQFGDNLSQLLSALKQRQQALDQTLRHTPILIKIAPDLTDEEVQTLASTFNELEVEGVIATNTTVSREEVSGFQYADEAGGLSGAPVREQANHVLKLFRERLDSKIPLIGVGGIMSPHEAEEKLRVGADLVQLYTGFIYHGPALVRQAIERVARL